jgi:DNA-directed RNA polymerase subunit RPC12/RpoP
MNTLFPEELIKTKFCKKCSRDLPLSNFGKASGGNYLYSECRECSRRLTKERNKIRKENPLHDPENHICPICNRTHRESFGSGGAKLKNAWVADHNHETKKFRGYICHTCNRGLGIFQDSKEILNRAIKYLESEFK